MNLLIAIIFAQVVTSVSAVEEVAWQTQRYYLHADHFEYQVAGEKSAVNMEDATGVDIGGDPGWEEYHSIEATWGKDGLEKRLYAYVIGNETHWTVYEARVYDQEGEWVYFYPQHFSGKRELCYEKEELVLTNDNGDEIRFWGLTIATFLPWSDDAFVKECIEHAFDDDNDDAHVFDDHSIQLCGCPSSACPGRCADFKIGQCTPMYQCFLRANGLFGYLEPEETSNEGEIIVHVYNDASCLGSPRFDPTTTGWSGSCDSSCWSDESRIGAGAKGCFDSSGMAARSTVNVYALAMMLCFVAVLAARYV